MILVYDKVLNHHYIENDDFECSIYYVPILKSPSLELINQTEQKMNEGLYYRCFNCGDAEHKTYETGIHDDTPPVHFCAPCFKRHIARHPLYMVRGINDKALTDITHDEDFPLDKR